MIENRLPDPCPRGDGLQPELGIEGVGRKMILLAPVKVPGNKVEICIRITFTERNLAIK